jgi:hypothetical protein
MTDLLRGAVKKLKLVVALAMRVMVMGLVRVLVIVSVILGGSHLLAVNSALKTAWTSD